MEPRPVGPTPLEPRLLLLGAPLAETAGNPQDLPVDKPAALLYYLARRGGWVSRSELAFLFRPDAPESVALRTVRVLLHRAKERSWSHPLDIERSRVRFQIDTDVHAFRQALQQGAWLRALQLYRGPFLAGVGPFEVVGYETWLELERQELGREWRLAALNQAQHLEEQRDLAGAEGWLERLLAADPLDEEALQVLLRVLYALGKRGQLFDSYESFRAQLAEELEVEPLEATQALIHGLRGSAADPSGRSAGQSEPPAERHNLPPQPTRFIGRRRELAALGEALARPDARLLTLIGFGGVGKTRLALELAGQSIAAFGDGVWFVPLAGVTSPELIVPSIATAVGLGFSAGQEPFDQLASFLRQKKTLLLLDNFEHLVAGAVLLEELLEAAPGLKVLVTSRQTLELSAEWLFDLEGLAVPPLGSSEPLPSFDAVRLFVQRAERLSSGFVANRDTLEAVAALCRRVEGLPLALELAAVWTRSLGVTELVAELDRNVDLLTGRMRDLPERHRSLRSVFVTSWGRLDRQEQRALAGLSLFQGGFSLEAAERVAGAHLALLLALINRSLLRRGGDGRFSMHELVRQYAAEQREGQVDPELTGRFRRYYLARVTDQGARLRGPDHRSALAALLADIDNLRSACDQAILAGDWAALDGAASGIYLFLREASLFQEGRALFERLDAALEAEPAPLLPEALRLAAKTTLERGVFLRHLGLFRDAVPILRRAVAALRELDADPERMAGLQALATALRETDEPEEAAALLEEALTMGRSAGSGFSLAETLFATALLERDRGRPERARELLERCVDIHEQRGDEVGVALATAQLALVARMLHQDLATVRRHTERALEIFRSMGHKKNEAVAINNLAAIAHYQGDDDACERLMRESLAIKRHLGDLGGQMLTLINLGTIVRGRGRHPEATGYFEEALGLARRYGLNRGRFHVLAEMGENARQAGEPESARGHFEEMLRLGLEGAGSPRHTVAGLLYLAAWHEQTGRSEQAFLLATVVLKQQGSPPEVRNDATALRDRLAGRLSEAVRSRLEAEAAALDLSALLARELTLLEQTPS